MGEAECNRIGPGGLGQFVHEALDGEHIRIGPKPALGRDPHRFFEQEMRDHMRVREIVERDPVAIPAAFRLRDRLWLHWHQRRR